MVLAINIGADNFAPAKFTNIASFLNIILPLMTVGAALIFLVMGLYGAFVWLTSGGTQENLAKAQKIFINAVIGLVIVVIAFVLVQLIGYILQVDILPK